MAGLRVPVWFAVVCLMASPALACAPHIEERPTESTASFRPHTTAFERCEVDEATYVRVLGEWLHARAADAPELRSISLGRAVNFPWISRYMADSALQSPGWAASASRAKMVERSRLAAKVLNDPLFLQRLDAPFEGTRYTITAISFEKVLFGAAAEYSSSKEAGKVPVPFDAQLWLRLAPRK
jgi:hypothetical protein